MQKVVRFEFLPSYQSLPNGNFKTYDSCSVLTKECVCVLAGACVRVAFCKRGSLIRV